MQREGGSGREGGTTGGGGGGKSEGFAISVLDIVTKYFMYVRIRSIISNIEIVFNSFLFLFYQYRIELDYRSIFQHY